MSRQCADVSRSPALQPTRPRRFFSRLLPRVPVLFCAVRVACARALLACLSQHKGWAERRIRRLGRTDEPLDRSLTHAETDGQTERGGGTETERERERLFGPKRRLAKSSYVSSRRWRRKGILRGFKR
ncbi:hypothetical protein LX36DRAFT_286357 [Colletotrichum falcatum]|nr:hypothetical protein LX36DRAFT_286357 [Colletotrichum falcatum]